MTDTVEVETSKTVEISVTSAGRSLDYWWDKDENEHLRHDPFKCSECNYRWWTSRGFVPAVGRLGELHNND